MVAALSLAPEMPGDRGEAAVGSREAVRRGSRSASLRVRCRGRARPGPSARLRQCALLNPGAMAQGATWRGAVAHPPQLPSSMVEHAEAARRCH